MKVGYEQPLYILPFDHRGSFQSKLFGWEGNLTPEQTRQVSEAKKVVYDAFREAVRKKGAEDRASILVDEQFGSAIIDDAVKKGIATAMPVEKSGVDEFQFEYGKDFAKHIERFNPAFCKALVRYNPDGDQALNARQRVRLKELSDYLHRTGRRLMFELLVPPEKKQIAKVGGDGAQYDLKIRPGLMVRAMRELQDAGIEPDVWKIEGVDRRADCERIAQTARRGGRDHVGCIVLGRGESEEKVAKWLKAAAGVPGFIGFAVGRTTFWDPLVALKEHRISREEAVKRIAASYGKWVDVFERAK